VAARNKWLRNWRLQIVKKRIGYCYCSEGSSAEACGYAEGWLARIGNPANAPAKLKRDSGKHKSCSLTLR